MSGNWWKRLISEARAERAEALCAEFAESIREDMDFEPTERQLAALAEWDALVAERDR